jgi:hypothetical protein
MRIRTKRWYEENRSDQTQKNGKSGWLNVILTHVLLQASDQYWPKENWQGCASICSLTCLDYSGVLQSDRGHNYRQILATSPVAFSASSSTPERCLPTTSTYTELVASGYALAAQTFTTESCVCSATSKGIPSRRQAMTAQAGG